MNEGEKSTKKQFQLGTRAARTFAAYYLIAGIIFILATDALQYLLYPEGESIDITLWQTVAALVFVIVTGVILFFFIRYHINSQAIFQRSLSENETRFRMTLDSLPNVLVIYDNQLRFQYINATGVALSGYTLEELLGRRDDDVFPTESICEYLPLLKRTLQTRRPQKRECSVVLPNGQKVITEMQYVPILDEDGGVSQIIGISHNITDRKHMEETLRSSEEQFRLLAENLPGVVYTCQNDEKFSTIYVNHNIEKVTGYKQRQFLDQELNFSDIIHPDDMDEIVSRIDAALAKRMQYHLIYRMRNSSGEWRWIEEEGHGIFKNDNLKFLQGFFTDITDYRRIQEKQQILTKLGQGLAAAETIDKVGEIIVDTVSAVWDWDALLFSVHQSGETRVRNVIQADTINGEKIFEYNEPATIPAKMRQNKPNLILREPDAPSDGTGRFGDVNRPSATLMYCPIRVGDRKGGLLSVQSYRHKWFNNDDLDILQAIAEVIAPAVERCRVEERSRAFASLGEELNATITPEEAAEKIVAVADELIGWDACIVSHYSQKEDLLYNLVGYDVIDGKRTPLVLDDEPFTPQGYSSTVLKQGQLLILRHEDNDTNPSTNAFGDKSKISQSLMFATLRGLTEITGTISLQSYTRDAYDNEDLHTLKMLANHCSNALERTRAQQKLELREANYRTAITFAGAVPYQLDYTTKSYVFMGEGIEAVTGWTAEEFDVKLWNSIIQEVVEAGTNEPIDTEESASRRRVKRNGTWRADIRILTKSGESRWVADTSVDIPDEDGYFRGSLGILQDITERKENENRLLYDSLHDPLTGLANRTLLLDHLQLAIHRAHRRNAYCFAVLFIDIDRFKKINDSLGHLAGDRLLVSVAQRLRECVRPDDTVARFAGDEFVILLDDVCHSTDVVPVAERIMRDVGLPVTLEGQEVFASVSMGIALSSQDYVNPEDVLRDADNALYQAKSLGKGRFEIFDSSMYDRAVTTLALETDMRRGLERQEFVLHYQPIVDLRTGSIVKFEALLRWNHPVRGMVAPIDFIPMAEETGLIIPLGFWVIEEAAAQLKKWHDQFPQEPPLAMSVNLSVRQFSILDLDSRLHSIVRSKGIDPKHIKLEITETVFLEKNETIVNLLNRLQALGFGLSLDDFGTGYSSLSNLHQFPIDWIKIDRSFTSRMEEAGTEREIVRSIVQLAANLGMGITAEGVETAEQLDMLAEMNCCHVQGYYLSRPLPATEAEVLIARKPVFGQVEQ